MVAGMTGYSKRISESTFARKALDDVGAEPLAGSGFENETPEPEFSDQNIPS
jgi:hypothetical protein